MSSSGEGHPAEAWEAEVRRVQARGNVAIAALGVTVLTRVVQIGIQRWQSGLISAVQAGTPPSQEALELSDRAVQLGAMTQLAVLLVTGIVFLRWLHGATRCTRGLGGDTLRWTPKEAVTGFIIPFLNITRPFQIVRDLHDHLAPELLPAPQAQVVSSEHAGYRSVELREPPPAVRLPHASIGAWWGTFWLGNVFGNIAARQTGNTLDALQSMHTLNTISDSIDVVSASLAIVMVRGVTARLAERLRRVRHNPVEVLQAHGVTVEPPTP
ncbi:MAG: DUF4328 domain-containing protein [Polyangiales bacterium]